MKIIVDFDRTLSKGFEAKEPEPGAKEALIKLKEKGFYISIHSCRTSRDYIEDEKGRKIQRKLIENFLNKYEIPYDEIIDYFDKPIASYYIDDSAICYKGNWQAVLEEIIENESN